MLHCGRILTVVRLNTEKQHACCKHHWMCSDTAAPNVFQRVWSSSLLDIRVERDKSPIIFDVTTSTHFAKFCCNAKQNKANQRHWEERGNFV